MAHDTLEDRRAGRLSTSIDGALGRLVIDNQAARNAISSAMWAALPDAVADLAANSDVKIIVIAGAGTAAFSAGADIAEFAEVYKTPEAARAQNDLVRAGQQALADCPKPTVAMIYGPCVGGGLGLAVHADLRFASSSATFAIPPARLGAVYSFADTRRLAARVGASRATDLLFSGRTVEADEAHAIGLVDFVHPDDALDAAVDRYVSGLARLSQQSLRAQKAILREILAGAVAETDAARATFDAAFASEDFREGYAAFLEKRRPTFTGQ